MESARALSLVVMSPPSPKPPKFLLGKKLKHPVSPSITGALSPAVQRQSLGKHPQ